MSVLSKELRFRFLMDDREEMEETPLKIIEENQSDPTYWKRVRYPEIFIEEKIRPWRLEYIEGQGCAAFATRAFKAGDWICTEFPVVWIHGHHPFNDTQIQEIHEKVEELNEEDRTAFFAMANMFPEYPPAVGIFMTNCFDMTDSIYGTTCAMYLALARLNHSCAPNVQQSHLPDTTEEVLFASRDIAIGDEINDCYIDLRANRASRMKSLQEYYRFTCGCISCSISDEKLLSLEDSQRERLSKFEDEIITMIEDGDKIDYALTYSLKLLSDLETPEMMKWSIRYLPEVYHMIYQIEKTLADLSGLKKEKSKHMKSASKYLKKCCKLNILLQGDRSPDSRRTLMELKELMELENK